ncbi:MAG: hypothetical protein HYZ49_18670 [Chloroflexi bacterium]|nr:hypothetical protein [Chloroflexota bacterium]
MLEIGQVKLVQVQRASLKFGERPNRYYDPSPLLVVERLRVLAEGAVGETADGGTVVDVHHTSHPDSKNIKGANGLSLGFTSHYRQMQARYGDHVFDGCAGENIIVEANGSFGLDDLGHRLAIQNSATGQFAYFTRLLVAAPCVEFSHFVNRDSNPLPAGELKATLQFLDDGRRGFYATLEGQPQVAIQAGDKVFRVDNG